MIKGPFTRRLQWIAISLIKKVILLFHMTYFTDMFRMVLAVPLLFYYFLIICFRILIRCQTSEFVMYLEVPYTSGTFVTREWNLPDSPVPSTFIFALRTVPLPMFTSERDLSPIVENHTNLIFIWMWSGS